MRLYHVTSARAAAAILADGFRDGEGTYLTSEVHRGVWLTDDPVGVRGSGAVWARGDDPDTILRVELDQVDEAGLAAFEWINEGFEGPAVVGVNYREWLVSAEWLRAHSRSLAIVPNDDELRAALEGERKPVPPLPPLPEP